MGEKATWLPHSEEVEIVLNRDKAPYGPQVMIRRADGTTLSIPRHEVLMSKDDEMILQLQQILLAKNPARNPAYFSTVKNLLSSGAPLSLVNK
jgi:hypothetical protein